MNLFEYRDERKSDSIFDLLLSTALTEEHEWRERHGLTFAALAHELAQQNFRPCQHPTAVRQKFIHAIPLEAYDLWE
jgi:hypothetical protein